MKLFVFFLMVSRFLLKFILYMAFRFNTLKIQKMLAKTSQYFNIATVGDLIFSDTMSIS
jgi:hypothetical protein